MHVCGMCMLPVLSMILMVIIRYISAVLVWILTVLVVLGSLGKFALFVFTPYFSDWNSTQLESICFGITQLYQFLFLCQIPVCCCIFLKICGSCCMPGMIFQELLCENRKVCYVFVGGTSFLWWLYIDHRLKMNETVTTDLKEATETNEENGASNDHIHGLLVYASSATVFTVSQREREGERQRLSQRQKEIQREGDI